MGTAEVDLDPAHPLRSHLNRTSLGEDTLPHVLPQGRVLGEVQNWPYALPQGLSKPWTDRGPGTQERKQALCQFGAKPTASYTWQQE